MNKKTGGPAFPGLHPSKECHYQDAGMTLRDYFAARALAGLLANKDRPGHFSDQDDATYCYSMADAMLKAREA